MDSETGRFISEDPAKDQKNPNLYTYCRNNPLTVTDPTGKWSQNKNGDWVCDNKNDTLWSLAEKVYGDGSQWELLNYNLRIDPTKLQIGDTLNSKRFGIANTSIGPQTPADKFRNTASKVIKYIPGVNIVNDAFGAVTGQDLTGNLLLTEKEKFDAKFSTLINIGTLGAGAYLASLEKSAALSLGETAATLKTGNLNIARTSGLGKLVPQSIETPYGPAYQSISMEAIGARNAVLNGASLYRGGTLGVSQTLEGQFWALESPLNPGYANRYGVASFTTPEFIEIGNLLNGSNFITRSAPGLGSNLGGGIEVVTSPFSVQLNSFIMP